MIIFNYDTKVELIDAIESNRFYFELYDGLFSYAKEHELNLNDVFDLLQVTTGDGYIYSHDEKNTKNKWSNGLIENEIERAFRRVSRRKNKKIMR